METPKQEVQQILNSLPEDATLEDIQYQIYVRQAIAEGIRDIEQGRIATQEEVEQRMARWTNK
jgi:predicted transcriptional regulator